MNYVDHAALYDDQSDAAAPAGSVVAYRPDVYHRSVDHTDPSRYRVMIHVSFRHRDAGWGGYQAWPFRGFSPELTKYVQGASAAPACAPRSPTPRPPLLGQVHDRRDAGALSRSRHVTLARRSGREVARWSTQPASGEPGATNGHGISRSATSARSSSNCSRWWPAKHLHPDRQPVDQSPPGMLIAGLPLRFEGAVSAALFMMARVNPISLMRSLPGQRRGRRALSAERHVGMRRAEDEVRLIEEVGHGPVELTAVPLDRGGPLERVALLRASQFRLDLRRELIDPVGVGVVEVDDSMGGTFAIAQAPRSGGSVGTTRTRRSPAALARCSAAAATTSATSSRTWAMPRSTTMAAVMPERSCVPSPASHPCTRGRLNGSRWSNPLQASK